MDFLQEIEVAEAVMDNKLMHLYMDFDKLMLEHKENITLIENKVLLESGTEDDLIELYAFEAEDVKNKGKGILSKIFGAIGAMFRKIKNFLFGSSKNIKEDELPEQVEVPEDPSKLEKEAKGLLGGIKGFFSGNKNALANAGKIAAVTGGAFVLTKKAIIPTIKNLEELANETDKAAVDAANKCETEDISPEEQTMLKQLTTRLQNTGKRINKIISSIPKMGTEDYKDIRDKNKQKRKDEKEAEKANKENEKNEKLNARDYKNIEKQQNIQKNNASKMEDISKENQKIDNLIKSMEKRISSLKKDNGSQSSNIFSKGKASVDQHRLKQLEELGKKGRSDKQEKEYLELLNKYGAGNVSRSQKLSEYESVLSQLKKQKERNNEKLENRAKEASNAKRSEILSNIKKSERGSITSGNVIDKAEALLNANESTFDSTFDDIEHFIEML